MRSVFPSVMVRTKLAVSVCLLTAIAGVIFMGSNNGPPSAGLQILPLGDSITQGDRQRQSYRYRLWQALVSGGYTFDLIGSMSSNFGGNPSFPALSGTSFDSDHEGHWGWRADEIVPRLRRKLAGYTPDLVLLHLGTNDLFAGHAAGLPVDQVVSETLDDLQQIIAVLRSDNPRVAVLAALLFPSDFPSNAFIDAFNRALPPRAAVWNSPDSPVTIVDQNSGVDPDPTSPESHSHDGVHPNQRGEALMAERWMAAIQATGILAPPSPPQPDVSVVPDSR